MTARAVGRGRRVLGRRRFVLGAVALGAPAAGTGAFLASQLVGGCSTEKRKAPTAPAAVAMPADGAPPAPPTAAPRLLTMTFDEDGGARKTAAVLVPQGPPDARYPVLVALHGRGEALKGPERGAFGWPNDYALTRAIERIAAPPITAEDLQGFVDEGRLAEMNRDLAARPYGGLIVACPYVPDLDLRSFRDMRAYGRWLVESFLPRVRGATPAIAATEATGIDGVSLGGATALRVGFLFPEAFGAVGALQPAVFEDQAQEWAELARAARAKRPGMALRLLTSREDYYRGPVTRVSQAWRAAGVDHAFVEVPGPHDYPFNRGPGAYELLFFHDRALRPA